MDTDRIIINNIDQSSTTTEVTSNIIGFTVLKAPKGPIYPIRISGSALVNLQDSIGISSYDYPEIFEAEKYIEGGYDLYVSAPYNLCESISDDTGTQIPVAYYTSKGVFASIKPIHLLTPIENLEEDPDISIEGINTFNNPVAVKINVSDMGNALGIGYYTSKSFDSTTSKISFTGTFTISNLTNLLNTYAPFTPLEAADYNYQAMFCGVPLTVDSTGTISYNASSVGTIAGASISITLTNSAFLSALSTSLGVDNISASYFSTSTNLDKVSLYWLESIGNPTSNIYATIYPTYPSERTININFTEFNSWNYIFNDSTDRNTLKLTVKESGGYQSASFEGSLDNTSTSFFSTSNSSYIAQKYVRVCALNTIPSDVTVAPPLTSVILEGGIRSISNKSDSDIHDIGWAQAQAAEFDVVDIFFDSQRHSEDNESPLTSFTTLANIHQLAIYLYNQTIAPIRVTNNLTSLDYGHNYWNICNYFRVKAKSSEAIMTACTGAAALNESKILDPKYGKYGGAAPTYLNDENGLGGQLSLSSAVPKYKYTAAQQTILGRFNYNPIIKDTSYGIIITGHKSSKSGTITDWSYIGHVASFLNFQKQIKINVMIPQLQKANNDFYRDKRALQCNNYLDLRLNSTNPIWAEGIVDTSTAAGVNDTATRKALQFKISIKVKVNIFSEWVILNFTNVDQDTTLVTTETA